MIVNWYRSVAALGQLSTSTLQPEKKYLKLRYHNQQLPHGAMNMFNTKLDMRCPSANAMTNKVRFPFQWCI